MGNIEAEKKIAWQEYIPEDIVELYEVHDFKHAAGDLFWKCLPGETVRTGTAGETRQKITIPSGIRIRIILRKIKYLLNK